jgi:cytoskeletal protein RodZ
MVAAPSATSRTTPSVGQRLRLRREQQKRTVAELSAETCITSRYLEAIEADDQKPLPGFFFYRNYVKQYARALGLDGTQLYNELATAAPVDDATLLATLSKEYTPKRTAPAAASRPRRWIGYVFAGLALVAASAGFTVAARSRDSAAPIATVKLAGSQPATAAHTAVQR